MAVEHICPVCGSRMFHDKSNHVTFCSECDHVGWPHDAPASMAASPDGAPPARALPDSPEDEAKPSPARG